ncbi:MAG: hypothetical protein QGH94_11990 [Phycisphaerae bacterium]|jgi:hypothetical protein|nr:hypothetical protein [Phycisphaerae bacterium]
MKNVIISALAAVLISSTVFGGALDTRVIGGEATWVAHVDVEAMLSSEMGKMFLARAEEKRGFAQGLIDIKKTLGFDPLEDIRGITVYGPKIGQQDGVVVIDATVAADKLIDLLKEKKSYQSDKHGQHTIHQWTEDKDSRDKGQKRYGCFYDNKTVVVATGAKSLNSALDVLDGKADAMAKTKTIGSLPEVSKGAFLVLAADKIEFPEGKAPRAAILKGVTAMSVQCGECDGQMFLNASMTAGSEADADNIRKLANGFLAFAEMMRQQEKFAALQELGEKIEIGGKGKEVRVDASISVKSMVKVLTFMEDAGKARRHRRSEPAKSQTRE